MQKFDRITHHPGVMGGQACLRGLRVTASMIVGMIGAGNSKAEVLRLYPYLEPEDIDQALAYAAWRLREREIALAPV